MKKGWQRDDARQVAEEDCDYVFSERDHSAKLTEQGQNRVLRELGIKDLYSGANLDWLHYIDNALRANTLYKRDHHYVVKEGQVIIVDEFTGRLMEGRRWSDGLHQAVEAKERLRIKDESQTVATITFQNFFKLYGKLAGMTGTAMTEAKEFGSIYKLSVVSIPTNRPLLRKNWPDLIYGTETEKYQALQDHIAELHAIGRPLLIGTVSIERSEQLSALLEERGIPHDVLNAKHHAREAEIVAEAGHFGHVTIATNMAGRGTDIKLGTVPREELLAHWQTWGLAPKDADASLSDVELEARCLPLWAERWLPEEVESGAERSAEEWRNLLRQRWAEYGIHPVSFCERVADLGGLHVVGTERHEARRIDNQLRGRCARQGDPGSSRFFLSLDDDLMRIFAPEKVKAILRRIGLSDGMPLEHGMVSRRIEGAQRRVEERNFEIRKSLLEYDEVMNEQRLIVYERRQAWLEERGLRETALDFLRTAVAWRVEDYAPPESHRDAWDLPALTRWLEENLLVEFAPQELAATAEDPDQSLADAIMARVEKAYATKEREIGERAQRELEKYLLLQTLDRKWMDHLYAMDLLKQGIHLRGYAGQDPKLLYKREGYEMFEELWGSLQDEVAGLVLKVRPVEEDEELEYEEVEVEQAIHDQFGQYEAAQESAGANAGETHHEPIVRNQPKVGPNDACPCGSGRKYKKCCMRRAKRK
jgi:preprotein translocase subunit SecA